MMGAIISETGIKKKQQLLINFICGFLNNIAFSNVPLQHDSPTEKYSDWNDNSSD